ncbi:MAG: hypothetical protein M0015_06505 [Betaproteobacteria bacterium]|nr:hypothetical protein [Betaproteobacteria bacterium]
MGMPVKLSDRLVADAKSEASKTGRSTTRQVEHWARIGREAEKRLPKAVLEQLTGAEEGRPRLPHPVVSFFERLEQLDLRGAVRRKLAYSRFPVYEADPDRADGIIEVHEDGRRVAGTWDLKAGRFVPGEPGARARRA